MRPSNLQNTFTAAVSRINDAPSTPNIKRHTPIFQRGSADRQRQAVKDAAEALAALWKIGESNHSQRP